MMNAVKWLPMPKDGTLWLATFDGLKVNAFGKEQILQAATKFQVMMERETPFEWTARVVPGHNAPFCRTATAEEAMRMVEAIFTTVVKPWTAYTAESLKGRQAIKPALVSKADRRKK